MLSVDSLDGCRTSTCPKSYVRGYQGRQSILRRTDRLLLAVR